MRCYVYDYEDIISYQVFQVLQSMQEQTNSFTKNGRFGFNDLFAGFTNLSNKKFFDNEIGSGLPVSMDNLYILKNTFQGKPIFRSVDDGTTPEQNDINYLIKVCHRDNKDLYIRAVEQGIVPSTLDIEEECRESNIKNWIEYGFLKGKIIKKKPVDKILYSEGFDKLINTEELLSFLKKSEIDIYVDYAKRWADQDLIENKSEIEELEKFMFKDFLSDALTSLDYKKIEQVCYSQDWKYGLNREPITARRIALDMAETVSRVIKSAYEKIKSNGFENNNPYICLQYQTGRLISFFYVYSVVNVGDYDKYDEEEYFIEYDNKRYYFTFTSIFSVDSFETSI